MTIFKPTLPQATQIKNHFIVLAYLFSHLWCFFIYYIRLFATPYLRTLWRYTNAAIIIIIISIISILYYNTENSKCDGNIRHDIGFGKKLLDHWFVLQYFNSNLHSKVVAEQNVYTNKGIQLCVLANDVTLQYAAL